MSKITKLKKTGGFEKNRIRMSEALLLCGYTRQVVLEGLRLGWLFDYHYNLR